MDRAGQQLNSCVLWGPVKKSSTGSASLSPLKKVGERKKESNTWELEGIHLLVSCHSGLYSSRFRGLMDLSLRLCLPEPAAVPRLQNTQPVFKHRWSHSNVTLWPCSEAATSACFNNSSRVKRRLGPMSWARLFLPNIPGRTWKRNISPKQQPWRSPHRFCCDDAVH